MITRIYIDNYKTFVNFEWKPDKLVLLMGANGTGKSSIPEVLWALRSFMVEHTALTELFPGSTRTRWDKRTDSRIELDFEIPSGNGGLYGFRYALSFEHFEHPTRTRVMSETVHEGQNLLLNHAGGRLTLYGPNGEARSALDWDADKSGFQVVAAHSSYRELLELKAWMMHNLLFIQPDPRRMSSRTDERFEVLRQDMSNFATWFPKVVTKDPAANVRATETLTQVIDGFKWLRVSDNGAKLQAQFGHEGASYTIDFDSLSDGQRQLCALYYFWNVASNPERGRSLVVIDEPDNYVALREIQPWLMEVLDRALTLEGPQVWIISHHPEILNLLAPAYGRLMLRRGGGPSRHERFRGFEGLTSSEAVARGWEVE